MREKIRKPFITFCFLFGLATTAVADDQEFKMIESVGIFDNTRIATFTTPVRARPSSGIFIYSHGMTSRTLYHSKLFKAVYEAGYDVMAYDLPGHGNSERTLGLRGGVKGFPQMTEVLDGIVKHSTEVFGSEKIFISGWSLGGLISTIYLQQHPGVANAAVLYAPGIAFAFLDGNFSILSGVKSENLVSDKGLAETLRNDESFFSIPPPCLAKALITGILGLDSNKYSTNTLLFTAGRDYFVSTPRTEAFFESAKDKNAMTLETVNLANSLHDVENDVDSETVIKTTIEYLNRN